MCEELSKKSMQIYTNFMFVKLKFKNNNEHDC